MVYYLIGGLGADKRVFDSMFINTKTIFLNWIKPNTNESLASYVNRLSAQIDTNTPFGIIGVSFVGIVAVELNKIIRPSNTVLISSVVNSMQLPKLYILMGKLGLLNFIPTSLLKPPQSVMNYMFSANNKPLLKKIIIDTDPNFIRWAL